MQGPVLAEIGLAAGTAGATLLFSILAQRLASRPSELWSEALCWAALGAVAQRPNTEKSSLFSTAQPAPKTVWIAAVGICMASVYKTELGLIGFFPALALLILLAEQLIAPELDPSTASDSKLSAIIKSPWGTLILAALFVGTLIQWNFRHYILSLLPIFALLPVYVAFIPRRDETSWISSWLPPILFENAIRPLSKRVVILLLITLGFDSAVFGFPQCKIIPTLGLGATKALSWAFLFCTTRHASWRIAVAVQTFSLLSTLDPSDCQAFTHVAASFMSLLQIAFLLPREAKGKLTLCIFSLIFLAPYLSSIYTLRNPPSMLRNHEHPIQILTRNANAAFDQMIKNQSRSYTDARDEYRRRYNAEPPPGFEAWYEFAESHQSPIIDEFNIIHERIAPFWTLSGREILGIISRAQNQQGSELWSCNFNGHRAFLQCTHPYRTFDRHLQLLFNTLLGNVLHVLPDFTFLVNHIDEPRVLLPQILYNGLDKTSFNTTYMSRHPVWDSVTGLCSTGEPRQMDGTEPAIDTFGLPFVADAKAALDLCRHPEYKHMHGLTASPMSFNLIEGFVPVLSTGSLSTMGDILYPSPAYMEPEFHYDEEHDLSWEDKRNNLYWAGSTTGGFAADGQRGQWQAYHRQRFVNLAQNLDGREHEYLRETAGGGDGGTVSRVRSSFFNGRLFDVSFTRIFQCARTACRDQRMHFRVRPWAHKDAALQSRLVFDLDGNGISGRYYKLLASRSAPLKQTLLREWHDDRLVPWVHYFPVSQSLRELPELVSYLTSSSSGAGQETAKAVADNGRKWFGRAFREVDMTIYTYRLLLELARLQDPRRPAGKVHLAVQNDAQEQ